MTDTIIGVIREFGSFGVLIVFFLVILPKQTERMVVAMEDLSKVFVEHNERSILIQGLITELKRDVCNLATNESIIRIHERLDEILKETIRKE